MYLIKETNPMWDINYQMVLPFIFKNKDEADRCLDDYEVISGGKVLCTEYELIKLVGLEIDNDANLKGISIHGRQVNMVDGDYEETFKYRIHNEQFLKDIGRFY